MEECVAVICDSKPPCVVKRLPPKDLNTNEWYTSLLSCFRPEDVSPPPWCVPLHLRAIRWLRATAGALPAPGGLQHRQGPQRCHGKPRLQHPARLQGGAGLWHVSDPSLPVLPTQCSWWSRDFVLNSSAKPFKLPKITMWEILMMNDPGWFAVCCLTGLSMATTPRRSTLWRYIYTILRWSKGKVTAARCSLILNRDHPMLLLFDTECQTACAWLHHLTKLESIAAYSVEHIDWVSVCVFVCVRARKHAGRLINLPEWSVLVVTMLGDLCWQRATDSHRVQERKREAGGWRRGQYVNGEVGERKKWRMGGGD